MTAVPVTSREKGQFGPRVAMFGPDLSARGGIASVASLLVGEPSLGRFNLRYIPTWADGGSGRRLAVFARALSACTRLQHGDIAHVHMSVRGSFLRKALIVLVAKVRGARIVLHLHSGEFNKYYDQASRAWRRVIRWVFAVPDRVLVLSPIWVDRVSKLTGRNDVTVLPNPVRQPEQSASMEGPRRVVFVGRLTEKKGVSDLLGAVAILQSRGFSDVEWVLAGEGDLVAFERCAQNLPVAGKVAMPGWLPPDAIWQTLSASWVLCLPSHDEGMPVALLEGMAFGLACVATPVGGIPDLIDPGRNGMMVDVGDCSGLADALELLLSSRERCLRMGARGRALIEERHASEVVGRVLGAIYDDLLAGSAGLDEASRARGGA